MAGNPPTPEISSPWSQRHLLKLSFGARAPTAESQGGKGSLGFDSCHNDKKNKVTPDKEPAPGIWDQRHPCDTHGCGSCAVHLRPRSFAQERSSNDLPLASAPATAK